MILVPVIYVNFSIALPIKYMGNIKEISND